MRAGTTDDSDHREVLGPYQVGRLDASAPCKIGVPTLHSLHSWVNLYLSANGSSVP